MLYLTLRQYEYIAAIGREGSLSTAAAQLNVSQPALSNALIRVEAHLGYELFIRTRGSAMAVTPQGRRIIEQAEALLAQAALIEDPLHPRPSRQRLHIGCFSDLAPFLLAPALQGLRRMLPDVTITYGTDGFEALLDALLKGRIDVAITYDLGMDAGFDREPLYVTVPHVLTAPDHPLACQSAVSLADLTEHPLILSDEGLSSQHMLGLFHRQRLAPVVAHRAASLELMRSLAAHGEGVGLSYAVPPGNSSYDGKPLIARPLSDPDARESVVLARHGTGPADPLVARTAKILTEMLGKE